MGGLLRSAVWILRDPQCGPSSIAQSRGSRSAPLGINGDIYIYISRFHPAKRRRQCYTQTHCFTRNVFCFSKYRGRRQRASPAGTTLGPEPKLVF